MGIKRLFFITGLMCCINCLYAEIQGGGQAGAFLRRGVNSHAIAMGSAFTAIANDASALYWNPAGLCQINNCEFMSMYSLLSLDRKQFFLSFTKNFSKYAAVGFGWLKYGVGDIEVRDYMGELLDKFSDSENCFYFSVAKKINIASLGLSAKYIHHSLYDYSANGLSFDLGAMVYLSTFSIGLNLQDIGGSIKWDTDSNLEESIPVLYRLGAAYHPGFLPFVVSSEVAKIPGGKYILRCGAEYMVLQQVGLRAGFNGDKPALGAVLNVNMNQVDVNFDYALTSETVDDKYVQHITLRLVF